MKKQESQYPMPIREWSEDDRPREKLLKYGEYTLNPSVLSAFSYELIVAIMIRTRAPGESFIGM